MAKLSFLITHFFTGLKTMYDIVLYNLCHFAKCLIKHFESSVKYKIRQIDSALMLKAKEREKGFG